MIEKAVGKRLTARQVLQHRWFKDTEDELDIFDEQENHLIKKEFTYVMHK